PEPKSSAQEPAEERRSQWVQARVPVPVRLSAQLVAVRHRLRVNRGPAWPGHARQPAGECGESSPVAEKSALPWRTPAPPEREIAKPGSQLVVGFHPSRRLL